MTVKLLSVRKSGTWPQGMAVDYCYLLSILLTASKDQISLHIPSPTRKCFSPRLSLGDKIHSYNIHVCISDGYTVGHRGALLKMSVSQKTRRLEKCGVQINDNYGGVAAIWPHFKSHMRQVFFLALNGLNGPYTHDCLICSIIYSICIGRRKCMPPSWP